MGFIELKNCDRPKRLPLYVRKCALWSLPLEVANCKICFKSLSICLRGTNTKLSMNVFLTYSLTPGPAVIRTVCKKWVRSYHGYHNIQLSSYVLLLRRRSFTSRKVYISLETLLCFLQLSDRAVLGFCVNFLGDFWAFWERDIFFSQRIGLIEENMKGWRFDRMDLKNWNLKWRISRWTRNSSLPTWGSLFKRCRTEKALPG